jgi:hypothetical protein
VVEIVNLRTNQSELTIPLPGVAMVLRTAFSPDGRMLAAETLRNRDRPMPRGPGQITSIQVLDLQQGKELTPPLNHGVMTAQRAIWFTKDGKRLVVQCLDSAFPRSIWDWQAGKQVNEPIPEAPTRSRVSHDGRYELRYVTGGIEVIDRTLRPPEVVRQGRRSGAKP